MPVKMYGAAVGQRDLQRGRDRAEPMDARGLDQHARHAVETVERVHDHGDQAEHEADQHLRHVAETENHDEQRIERIDRDRVIGGEQRVERLAQARQPWISVPRIDADDDRRDARRRPRWSAS